MSAPPDRDADVAVVGAGLSGLAAARDLAAAGVDVVVLEARERVGGRLLNARLDGGGVVEIGGQWLGPTQDRAHALVRELDLRTFPTHAEGENLVELDGRPRSYRGTIPRVSPRVLLDAARAQAGLDRLAQRVDPAAPWEARDAERLDRLTLAALLESWRLGGAARALFELVCGTSWGASAGELGLLHVLAYVRAAGGLSALLDTEGGAQQDRVEGGSALLAEGLAARLGPRVVLGTPVRAIAHGADGVRLRADGQALRARRAILAVPPALAGRIAYDPPLPAARDRVAQYMPSGSLTKYAIAYAEPFWRDAGLSGEALSVTGPLGIVFDASPPSGEPGVLVGFAGGPAARSLGARSAAERRAAVLAGLARLFGPAAGRPAQFIEQDWSAEPWSRGGPTASFGPGGWTAAGPALRAPCGPLHWAGTETATRWMGFMDGALRAGERAAREVLRAA